MQSATLPGLPAAPASLATDTATDTPAGPADAAAPAGWQGFSRPLAGTDHWESHLAIDGMHCAACTLLVEQALAPVPGVLAVEVDGASQLARVVWDPARGTPDAWFAALQRAGYTGQGAADAQGANAQRRAQRLLLWRWLVAGFCMSQAMMYAAPMYLAAPGEITPDIGALLRWGAWMMTLPVLLFSSQPFLRAALRDLRHGRIGMDVPVALGLLFAFAASTAATFDPAGPWGGEVWYDSVTMFVFFLLSGRLLEQRLRDRTAGALAALVRSLPATVLRRGPDATWTRVAVSALRPGDTVRVLAGEAVPCDGLVTGGGSSVDEALLTGESAALRRVPGDAVIAGSRNLSGTLEVRVQQVGRDTRFAGIVALMERAAFDKPRLARLADRLAGPFLWAVLAAAAGAALWWWPAGQAQALGVAVAVLVVTCPCALSLATPSATLAAAGALARRGMLVRRLQALEDAAGIDTVVFDKTGTLTQDQLTLAGVRTRAGLEPAQALAWAAGLAAQSLHPVARALARAAEPAAVQDVREHPGQGVEGRLPGPPEGQLLRLGSASFCRLATDQGGGTQVHLADAAGWLASFDLQEAVRPDAAGAVQALRARGLQVQLLSGDRPEAVADLAMRLGIGRWHAGCSPEDKLAHVRRLQAAGRRVAMVGDGLNDGPVLSAADLSVALGQAVPLAQATADVVVQGGRVADVPLLLAQARRVRRTVRQNLAWAAVYNAACVPLAVAGLMPPWLAGLGMAASSLAVIAHSARLARLPSH